MALYLKWFSFASVIKNLDYSNKHTSKLRNEVEVNRRIDALKFWEEFGIKAAIAHAKASRSTLYNWRKALGGGFSEARPYGSSFPKRLRS